MLLFPIFLLVLFTATFLAPSPPALFGLIRVVTLKSSTWSTLPTPIKYLGSLSHSEEFLLPSDLVSDVTLPTRCDPSPIYLTPNSTIPRPFVHVADGHNTSTAVLFVVSLAMFNCIVYKLLVDDSESELPLISPCSTFAASSSLESIYNQIPAVNAMSPLLLSVDTTKTIAESIERERLPEVVTPPPFSSFGVTVLSKPCTLLEQPLPFLQVLTHEFSVNNTTDRDTDSATFPVSESMLDPSLIPETQSTDFESLITPPVVSALEVDDSKPGPLPKNAAPDTGAKDSPPLHDSSSSSHPHELVFESEPHDDRISSTTIEDTCESDAEGYSDETFGYTGVDWTPEVTDILPTPRNQDQASPPCLLLESSHDQNSGHTLSETSTPVHTINFSPRALPPSDVTPRCIAEARPANPLYASDDIQVGIKDQSERRPIIRCLSADDLGHKFAAGTNRIYAFTIPDEHTSTFCPDFIDDDTAHQQVTSLRADAPIFTPLSSGIDEVVVLAGLRSAGVGLKASIHAPKDETLRMQGCVGMSSSIHATGRACATATTSETVYATESLEPSSNTVGFQLTTDLADESKSSGKRTTREVDFAWRHHRNPCLHPRTQTLEYEGSPVS
ncbi:hypothetical protein F5148DRAFT_465970 [Russula earlei]|uniref:Uncharacterized protein n=1 Tax=Russula earlei TaxID=71964 RepID=A0ACC0UNF4_9AGAM|nr:hypothetical protein F5148DRAFT_465970 [Russula earlei]